MFGNNPASVADNPSVLTMGRPMKGKFSGASGFTTATHSIAPGGHWFLTMNTVDWDTDGYFNVSMDGFVVPWDGFFRLEGLAYTEETDTATMGVQITQSTGNNYNQSVYSGAAQGPNPWGTVCELGQTLRLDAGSVIGVEIFNNSATETIHVGGSIVVEYRGHI